MVLDYELLRTLHRLLRQQTDLLDQIERGPRKVKIVQSAEIKFEEELAAAEVLLKDATKLSREKQLHLGTREAKVEDMKNKLNAAASNREYQLLTDTIAADEQANSVLADEIFEILERMDVLEADLATAKENLAKAQQDTKKMIQTVEGDTVRLESELERIRKDLAESEQKIPSGELTIEYKRLVTGMGEDALASTDTETCGNCNQHLSRQFLSELMMKKPVFCQGCGGWLYITEKLAMGRE